LNSCSRSTPRWSLCKPQRVKKKTGNPIACAQTTGEAVSGGFSDFRRGSSSDHCEGLFPLLGSSDLKTERIHSTFVLRALYHLRERTSTIVHSMTQQSANVPQIRASHITVHSSKGDHAQIKQQRPFSRANLLLSRHYSSTKVSARKQYQTALRSKGISGLMSHKKLSKTVQAQRAHRTKKPAEFVKPQDTDDLREDTRHMPSQDLHFLECEETMTPGPVSNLFPSPRHDTSPPSFLLIPDVALRDEMLCDQVT
jgi:hypothetical protein